jgi:DNA ligase-1
MYDPDLRLYQTSKNLLRNVTTAPRPYTPWIGRPTPESLMQLLDQSSQGKARSAGSIERFMVRHGLIKYNDKEEVSLHPAWDIFSRVIDRDLKAGISGRTIRSLSWPGDSSDSVSRIDPSPSSLGDSDQPQMIRQRFRSSTEMENSETAAFASGKNKEFSCVKGHSFTDLDNISGELAKYCDRWFVSRKLDGVRVLALMDFYVLNDASQPLTCVDIQFVSRTGIIFSSLDKLKAQLKPLIDFPLLRHYLERDPMDISRDANGAVKRLVLDGEVCVMVPKDEQKATPRLSDPGLITPADQLWEDNGLTEDFSASVSGVTKNTTLEEPAYYAFDLLNWSEVVNRGPAKGDDMIGLTFGERIPELQALVLWLTQELQDREEKVVRITALNQLEIKATEMDESILGRAMDDGWEGLIFRADKPYVGTRT